MEDNNIQVKRTLEISEEDGMKSDEQKTGAESARESWHARNRSSGNRQGRSRPWLIFASVLAGITALVILASVLSDSIFKDDSSVSGAADISGDFIGVLYIEGTIGLDDPSYNQEYNISAVEGMMENDNNKAMMLYVNTPGGSVYESDELYLKIREYQETAKRPVYVYMASQATSGGYYISASADRIIANRNCWTGSIGVTLGTLIDVSELLDEYGIKTETITSGKNKAMGSITEPMTSEQKKIFQSLADEAYDQFVSIVAEGRGMDEDQVRKIADGRIYTAVQARDNGLVDEVADSFEAAKEALIQEYDLESCKVCDFRYEAEESLFDTFVKSIDKLAESMNDRSDIGALSELMDRDGSLPLQYMCEVTK